MTISPVPGKEYKTRDGRKALIMRMFGFEGVEGFIGDEERAWRKADGSHFFGNPNLDLVSEWTSEPDKLQLEEGRYYLTRDGRKVGPTFRISDGHFDAALTDIRGSVSWCFHADGRRVTRDESHTDLVSEWTDTPTGPVIEETVTTTRKRIVEGVYGRLWVSSHFDAGYVRIDLAHSDGSRAAPEFAHGWSLSEIRDAISTLTALKGALETTNDPT